MLSTIRNQTNEFGIRLYLEARRHADAASRALLALARDERGQSGETSMLMRISLVVAILLAIGGLIYAALQALGVDVASKIRNPGWGG